MEVSGQLHASLANLHLGRERQVPSEQDDEWTAESVWMLWRRGNTTCPLGERNLESSVVQSLAYGKEYVVYLQEINYRTANIL
jgi:hypothetical protein